MALPEDAMGKLGASVVESTQTEGVAVLITADADGNKSTPNLNTESNTS